MNYSIYNVTGLIVRVVSVPDEAYMEGGLFDGESYVEGRGEPGLDTVVDGVIVHNTPPPPDYAQLARDKRDYILAQSDWTQLPDVPLEAKAAWATYRQALRDVTDQPGFPENVIWPERPA